MSTPPSRPSWASDFGTDEFGTYATGTISAVPQRFRWCPPGSFMMGSPDDEPGRWHDEGPQHVVRLTKGFWLGDTPVTQALWMSMGRSNPSHFIHERRPVEKVTWADAMAFCTELGGTLPTEAQWEYACRAGTIGPRWDTTHPLEDFAWYEENSDNQTHPVAEKRPNPWGLYDMLGNVWEWCRDNRRHYPQVDVDDPYAEHGGTFRIRGCSWRSRARVVRAANRACEGSDIYTNDLGFRLMMEAHNV